MKTVAIVGAGPAGLVAAKTLLQQDGSSFRVTIFEAADRVGGMWRAHPNEKGEKCSPMMRTNLSRYTVAFPDLSWASVDLTPLGATASKPKTAPMFPQAWQVGRYLETYARKFIPEHVIRFEERVIRAERDGGWDITTLNTRTHLKSQYHFDYLLVASGFFDRPVPACRSVSHEAAEDDPRIQHSSQFRHVSSLFHNDGKLVVVGGGISGVEAAATAALQISNAKFSPDQRRPPWSESVVYHIASRPFYALPRYLPRDAHTIMADTTNHSPRYLPLDLVLYDLSRRASGTISASNGLVPPEKAQKGHSYIRSLLGDNLVLDDAGLAYSLDDTRHPAFTGIAETYAEFVRSGAIVPIRGRVQSISSSSGTQGSQISNTGITVTVISNTGEEGHRAVAKEPIRLSDVGGVIEATGFQVHLEYLSDSVKHELDYDPTCNRVPYLLARCSALHPTIRDIAFVGFYEGPYWTVMEMQARLVAQAWSSQLDDVHPEQGARSMQFDISESAAVRKALSRHDAAVPQFWMSDYVGLVEELARTVGVRRHDASFGGQGGPVFSARYCGQRTEEEAISVIEEVADVLQQSQNEAQYVAAAAFSAMQGKWDLQRKIDTRNSSMPSGTFSGSAIYHPREPTDSNFDSEYLYVEEGTLQMANGLSFPAQRRYVYRYCESTDTISAWFVDDDGFTTSTLFNSWEFQLPDSPQQGWIARGHHWCSPDTYKSRCEFQFKGSSLQAFNITYAVSGPKKDYLHDSWYHRPS